jgi:uncharacterized SAM-binding protein YcdF (DUF218 family)
VIDLLLDPLVLAVALLTVSTVLLLRRSRSTPALLSLVALVLLLLGSSRPITTALLQILESGQQPLEAGAHPAPDAIVVLGAGFRDRGPPRPVLSASGMERLLEGLRLARAYPGATLVFSGGKLTPEGENAGAVMASWAVVAGVKPRRVVAEERAATTRGNAVEVAALAKERGWTRLVVVTSAYHMPRSLAAFRRVGLDARPAPCDFTRAGDAWPGWLLPSRRALTDTHLFLHEVVGRIWYRLRGWA